MRILPSYAQTDGSQLAFNLVAALYAMTVLDGGGSRHGVFMERKLVARVVDNVFLAQPLVPEAARFVQSLDLN